MNIDFYIEQHEGFALGNFIACTPTIKALYEKYDNTPIPVLFNTDYVRLCYIESPYIEIINEPKGKRLFGSELICKQNNMTDYEYIYQFIIGGPMKHDPFIDIPEDSGFLDYPDEFAVFINGSGLEVSEYIDRKSIDRFTQEMIGRNCDIPIIGTGSLNDEKRNFIEYGEFGDVRQSLWLIANAKFVITNATGFYHAAGAMGKKQLVLWKNCKIPRCMNVNVHQCVATKDNWNQSIDKFLNANK